MTKNMVHRALSTLVEVGYLVRDHTGKRFEIGPGVLNLLGGEEEQIDFRAVCHPYLLRLHSATEESVFLSIIVGQHRVNIDSVEAEGRRVTYGLRGRSVPLYQTITSRMLLAQLSDSEIKYYLASVASHTSSNGLDPFDSTQLWAELGEFRQRGFGIATTDGSLKQLRANYACFALLDSLGRPHGAISVGGPLERFPTSRIKSLMPAMLKIVAELNLVAKQFPAEPVFLHRN